MIIKVQNVDKNWRIIEGARDVEYSNGRLFHTLDGITSKDITDDNVDEIWGDRALVEIEEGQLPFWIRWSQDGGEEFVLVATTRAYICNDDGQTLEVMR